MPQYSARMHNLCNISCCDFRYCLPVITFPLGQSLWFHSAAMRVSIHIIHDLSNSFLSLAQA